MFSSVPTQHTHTHTHTHIHTHTHTHTHTHSFKWKSLFLLEAIIFSYLTVFKDLLISIRQWFPTPCADQAS